MPFSMLTQYASTFPISGYENLPDDAGLLQRLIYGLKLCGIGMGVVFLILASLWLIIYCSKFLNRNRRKTENAPAEKTAPPAAPAKNGAALPPEDDEQTVAAIASAAISAYENRGDASYKIISIQKL